MSKNVQIVDKSQYSNCRKCKKTGIYAGKKCDVCNGTGQYKTEYYYLIATNKNTSIAFGVEEAGK